MIRLEGIGISDVIVGSIAVGGDRVAVVARTETISSLVYVIVTQVIGLGHSKRKTVRQT
jgi:hypothetical protein